MALEFLVLRGVNLYAEGDSGQTLNTHLSLQEIKLVAGLSEEGETFTPAAGNGAIKVPTNRAEIEVPYTLAGLQPEVMGLFVTPMGVRRKFTAYGALVNEYATTEADRLRQVVATMYGRLNADMASHSGSGLTGVEYTIHSVSKYVLQIGNREVLRFNIEQGGWFDAAGQRSRINQMLGISG
ncbi:phage major tail tube protein [Camelimonas lactis]|uniref:Tail tube protein n=1 Tax=Camelimonas lactis TaxID=659006 RepID=A0A4R2GRE3_9HYPH|nr:phage major tail tube protein [Camelimonas lactis]TCO12449.1 hypothetical protein EV666_10996 [Camelimonas lactis]